MNNIYKEYNDGIIYNADCVDVMSSLIEQGIKVDAIITDPPYGTLSCKWDSIIPFDKMWCCLKGLIKNNGAICLFGSAADVPQRGSVGHQHRPRRSHGIAQRARGRQ